VGQHESANLLVVLVSVGECRFQFVGLCAVKCLLSLPLFVETVPIALRSCTVEPVDILLLPALGRLELLFGRILVSFLSGISLDQY
jgi:hypothetical protein